MCACAADVPHPEQVVDASFDRQANAAAHIVVAHQTQALHGGADAGTARGGDDLP